MGIFKDVDVIDFSAVQKQLRKTPKDIIKLLQRWALAVETVGLAETRKVPGLHDEALKGRLKGYRSVRLGHKWRAIYKYKKEGEIQIVKLKEVTAHEY